MKRKSVITITAIFMGILCLVGLTFAAEDQAGEIKVINKIVTLSPSEGIKPTAVNSGSGTTVIWVNHDRGPVEILFLDKKVILACSSPVNFFVGKDGAYESAKIPFGGTASLCFTDKGKYEYIVKSSRTFYSSTTAREHRGIIWIK